MNKFIFQFVLGLLPWCAYAASEFDEGIKAYHKEDYALAAEHFEEHLITDSTDISAYYNLGLAYHELKRMGKAIWAFEKVLKLSPNDSEAREKIETSYNQLKVPVEYEPQLNRFTSALYGFSSKGWSIIAILLSCLTALFIVLYARSKQASFKKLMVVLIAGCAVLVVFSIVIASGSNMHTYSSNYAIVTQSKIPTYLESKDTSSIELTEGERLELTEDFSDEFVWVQTINEQTYLVKRSDIEMI